MFDRRFYREIRNWFAALSKFRRYVLFISSIGVPATADSAYNIVAVGSLVANVFSRSSKFSHIHGTQ